MPEPTVLSSRVPPWGAGLTLLAYLARRFRYQPEDAWGERIAAGALAVGGEAGTPDRILAAGETVSFTVVLNEPAVDTDVRLLHVEAAFAIATKPGQLPSHADGTFIKNTFVRLVADRLAARDGGGDVRLVHRLDRETSGLMVVARTKPAHAALMRQFAAGTVAKEYLALVVGRPAARAFVVEGAQARDPRSTVSIRQALVDPRTPGARPSRTEFRAVRDLPAATLLRCVPRTGRTNQIRVHLASVGHPVVGDKLYGRTDEEFLAFVRHVKAGGDPAYPGHAAVPRQLLHAARLAFDHPETGARVAFHAPLPPDFLAALAAGTIPA